MSFLRRQFSRKYKKKAVSDRFAFECDLRTLQADYYSQQLKLQSKKQNSISVIIERASIEMHSDTTEKLAIEQANVQTETNGNNQAENFLETPQIFQSEQVRYV